jgi:diguanylate cyclase (GGDEF)-like protein
LSGINSAIVRIRNRRELFDEACRIAVEHGNFGMAWVSEFDPVTLDVTPVAYAGTHAGDFAGSKTTARADMPLGQGVVGRAIRSGELVFVNDITAEAGIGSVKRREAIRRGYRSVIALPLLVEGAVFGTLTLYTKEPNFFNEDELKLLRELAGDISFALDHIAKTERLDYLAYYDGVTGIPNRKLFHERVVQLIHSLATDEQGIAVAVLVLERFRHINETLGMAAGDTILKQLAERLTTGVGEPGTVARISADRFAMALVPIQSATEIAHVLEQRVLAALAEPFRVGNQSLHIPAKAGVAVHPGDGRDAATLLLNAEAALTNAKRSGERYLFYEPQMNARVAQQLRIENELRKATMEEEFILFYQPRVDLASGRICGMEALIRWQHPHRGLVSPGEFIPVLEQTGMILEAGRWAIKRAVLDYAAWVANGLKPPRIAVNVSQAQLRRKEFVEDVKAALAVASDWDCVDIEITESMLMEDIGGNIGKLGALRATGIGVSLDDFGTGYSSLSWLARLPIDSLKIDRSFVDQMAKSPEQMAIVSTVISLARALNLKVVAEGVETEEQVNLLRLLRCDEAQGYLFYKPLPPEEMAALLR